MNQMVKVQLHGHDLEKNEAGALVQKRTFAIMLGDADANN